MPNSIQQFASVHRSLIVRALVTMIVVASYSATNADVTTTGSLILVEEGGIFDMNNVAAQTAGATAFALDKLSIESAISNVNDGMYGSAWIGGGDLGTVGPFVGIGFGSALTIQSFAFGRDNTGTLVDRTFGAFELQYTDVPEPDQDTLDEDWQAIGTIDLLDAGDHPLFVEPSLRHRFNFDPVNATAIRLIVPHSGQALGTAIDEIEIYQEAIPIQPPLPAFEIRPRANVSLTWDGNQGDFNSPELGAGPPDNLALLSNGTGAFGSSDLGDLLDGIHRIEHINDGLYGNNHSWQADATKPDPNPSVGLDFNGIVSIESIAWSRDNGVDDDLGDDTFCLGGECMGRTNGTYTLQFTRVSDPSDLEAESNDPITGWVTIGEIDYLRSNEMFSTWLRHEFEVALDGDNLVATGLRIKTSNPNIVIDELEIYGESLAAVVGDTNNDAVVDIADLNNVRNHFGQSGPNVLGDTNSDALVDINDLNNVRNNFGAGSAAVPEPASIMSAVLGIAIFGTWCVRWRMTGHLASLHGHRPRGQSVAT